MRSHCDVCGRVIDWRSAILRSWEGELFYFCSETCARSGVHLANEVHPDDDGGGVGPLAPGDLDDVPARERQGAN